MKGHLQSDNELSSAGTSTVVKIEASPSVLTPHDVQANDVDLLQGVQMILVKAEDQQISNDPQILQEAEDMQIHHNACLGKHWFAISLAFFSFQAVVYCLNTFSHHTLQKSARTVPHLEFLLVLQQWLSLLPSTVFSTL